MTYIYEEYDVSLFLARFYDYDRTHEFKRDGCRVLFEHLLEVAEDTGEPIEFDCISLCCDYQRYDSLKEFQEEYGEEYGSMEDIQQVTTVIPIDDEAFIIQSF